MTKIHPDLAEKLKQYKKKYEKVTEFAELLPLYAKQIIENEYTSDQYHPLVHHHNNIYFAWGINWHPNVPTNYPTKTHKEVGFVSVYVNCTQMFGGDCYSFAHDELEKVLLTIKCHFYDNLNSTFYFLPDEAEDGLNKIAEWYKTTTSQLETYKKAKRKAELEAELAKLG